MVPAADGAGRVVVKAIEVKRLEAQAATLPEESIRVAQDGAANDLLNQFIAKLQGEYAIAQNPTLIDQILTRN